MKDVVLQTRYPYTASIITIIWLGSAIVCIVRGDIPLELAIGMVSLATLFVAALGFTTPKH